MFSGKKIKSEKFSWKWILYFMLLMWTMTFACRYFSAHGIPVVETCKVEKTLLREVKTVMHSAFHAMLSIRIVWAIIIFIVWKNRKVF